MGGVVSTRESVLGALATIGSAKKKRLRHNDHYNVDRDERFLILLSPSRVVPEFLKFSQRAALSMRDLC
jgi:hypothetical protein